MNLVANAGEAVGQLLGASTERIEIACLAADLRGCTLQRRADLTGLVADLGLIHRLSRGPGDAAHRGDVFQLSYPLRHLLHIGQGLGIAQIVRGLDVDVLRQQRTRREMVSHRGITLVALRRGRQLHAIVEGRLHHQGAAAKRDENGKAHKEMGFGPPDDVDRRALPHSTGQGRPGRDPPATAGQHQDGGQQRDRREERHRDRNRQRRADTGERRQPGEDHAEERDSHGGRGRCDHLADGCRAPSAPPRRSRRRTGGIRGSG